MFPEKLLTLLQPFYVSVFDLQPPIGFHFGQSYTNRLVESFFKVGCLLTHSLMIGPSERSVWSRQGFGRIEVLIRFRKWNTA
jgi:hypothetical protein